MTDPRATDRFLSLFSKKRRVLCKRCGWTGLRDWTDADLEFVRLSDAGTAEVDPTLGALDSIDDGRTRRRKMRKRKAKSRPSAVAFDLNDLDTEPSQTAELLEPFQGGTSHPTRGRRSHRRRRHRSRRQEFIATAAATGLVMFLVILLGLTGSCSLSAENVIW